MMIKTIAKFTLIVTAFFVAAEVNTSDNFKVVNAPEDKRLTIVFAGDIMQHGLQITAAWNDSTNQYDYTDCFQYVTNILRQYDIAVANLEVTLAGEPYTGYPQFSAPDAIAVAARDAGFGILVTANNHSCDRGDKGVIRTARVLDSLGIQRTGTFYDSTDYRNRNPLIITKNNITVALLNYTYGTNGLPFNYPAMVNIIDEQTIIRDLEFTRSLNPDFIVVVYHWGIEYQSEPSENQRNLAQLTLDNGADAVIGSHPHVIQPVEFYRASDTTKRNQLVVYSLGNFVSNQRDRYRDGGLMVGFTFLKTWNRKTIVEPEYHLSWVYTPQENNKRKYYIVPTNLPYDDTASRATFTYNDADLFKLRQMHHTDVLKMTTFISDSRELLSKSPYSIPEATYKIQFIQSRQIK